LSAEENGSKTNSGKADAQNWQNAVHPDANFTQEKAADTTVTLIKPLQSLQGLQDCPFPSSSSGVVNDVEAVAT
jgi:hypothetical protein